MISDTSSLRAMIRTVTKNTFAIIFLFFCLIKFGFGCKIKIEMYQNAIHLEYFNIF